MRQLTTTLFRYEGELWYEFGAPQTRILLAGFTPREWREISDAWRQQPEEWQDRLAYVLGWGNLRYEVPQLMRMIVEGEKEVALTARDSLLSLGAEAVKAQFDEQCVEEFGLPANLLEPAATVNEVINYLETKSRYEIRCGEWKLKPERLG
jgi:hypothetical protein